MIALVFSSFFSKIRKQKIDINNTGKFEKNSIIAFKRGTMNEQCRRLVPTQIRQIDPSRDSFAGNSDFAIYQGQRVSFLSGKTSRCLMLNVIHTTPLYTIFAHIVHASSSQCKIVTMKRRQKFDSRDSCSCPRRRLISQVVAHVIYYYYV